MKYLLICIFFSAHLSTAQVTFLVNDYPETTPKDAEMYISGDFEGWTGGSEDYKLTKTDTGPYSITFEQRSGTILFKFTLGSWDSVEKGPNGEEISNRSYTFGGNGDTVTIKVDNWAGYSNSPSTASSNVKILSESFYIPELDKKRKIWIYLPEGYESGNRQYPVLYMHDGQNLFDEKTAFAGEWKVDEALDRMYRENGFELIVVAVDHGNADRISEYTPWPNPEYGGGEGDKYVDFLVNTLKPYVDENYRTLPEAENTGIMGSSLGGLVSFYALLKYPGTFGKAGVFSPSFWFSDEVYSFAESNGQLNENRMYLLGGGREGNVEEDNNRMTETLLRLGFPSANLTNKIVPTGTHSESFWSQYVEESIAWLWHEYSILGIAPQEVNIFPNPVVEDLYIHSKQKIRSVRIYNTIGRCVKREDFYGNGISMDSLNPGLYVVKVSLEDGTWVTKKMIKQ